MHSNNPRWVHFWHTKSCTQTLLAYRIGLSKSNSPHKSVSSSTLTIEPTTLNLINVKHVGEERMAWWHSCLSMRVCDVWPYGQFLRTLWRSSTGVSYFWTVLYSYNIKFSAMGYQLPLGLETSPHAQLFILSILKASFNFRGSRFVR